MAASKASTPSQRTTRVSTLSPCGRSHSQGSSEAMWPAAAMAGRYCAGEKPALSALALKRRR